MQDDEVNKNPVQDNTDMTQTTIEPSVVQPTAVANQAEIVPKKHTVLTVVLVIVAAVITLIAIIITIIIMVVFSLVTTTASRIGIAFFCNFLPDFSLQYISTFSFRFEIESMFQY